MSLKDTQVTSSKSFSVFIIGVIAIFVLMALFAVFSNDNSVISEQTKFGMTLDQRQQYFKEIVAAEDKARAEIEASVEILDPATHDPSKPFDTELYSKQFTEREAMIDELSLKYKAETLQKYGLTEEQNRQIIIEAHSSGWALE